MKILKWLTRVKTNLYLLEGDEISIEYNNDTLCNTTIKNRMKIDEVGITLGKLKNKDVISGHLIGKIEKK